MTQVLLLLGTPDRLAAPHPPPDPAVSGHWHRYVGVISGIASARDGWFALVEVAADSTFADRAAGLLAPDPSHVGAKQHGIGHPFRIVTDRPAIIQVDAAVDNVCGGGAVDFAHTPIGPLSRPEWINTHMTPTAPVGLKSAA
jgi:hypothetical protein